MLVGLFKRFDTAWFFHPVACWITLWVYGMGRVGGYFKSAELSREGWGQ